MLMRTIERFVLAVERLNEVAGRSAGWLTLAMVLVTFAVVILRYVFSIGFVWLQESYVWLHGIVFMVGAGYTLVHDGHVRVDIFYRDAPVRTKAAVNLFGACMLLLPFVIMIAWVSWPYVAASWQRLEGSREAGGLPGLFLLKTVLLVFSALLGLQGLAMIGRGVLALNDRDQPATPTSDAPGR
jgi:TRAP-type mannitol/chloroaromatic compound transport system permease small subunit